MLRFFIKKNVNFKQFQEFIISYNFDDLFFKINEKYFLINKNLNFVTDYQIYDEIGNKIV